VDAERTTRSRSYAPAQTAPERRRESLGAYGRNSSAHNEQAARNGSRALLPANKPARPQLRSRANNPYALLTDESQSENISGKEARNRQVKTSGRKQPSNLRAHFDPYRKPPAVPLRYASPPAKALPTQPGDSGTARPLIDKHPKKFSLTMNYVNGHKPDGDRLDNPEFIRVVRKQVLTGSLADTYWMVKSIFRHQDYDQYSMDSKIETFMGNTQHIYSSTVPKKVQRDYYEAVEGLYEMNTQGPHCQKIDRMRCDIAKHSFGEERTKLEHKVLRDMIWTLTPNQRATLRQTFPLLYGDHTVADDINWLYFDTVIRLYSKSDVSQEKWLKPVMAAASEEARIKARDKLMGAVHSRLSPAQRIELKSICKKRHHELLSSREPLLHTAIRTNNVKAVRAYVTNILDFAPPEARERLLLARGDTAEGKETGEAAFFRLLHSGSEAMIEGFVVTILASTQLTLEQKWSILDARRPNDNVSAFNMLMGLGDWPRVRTFVSILTRWNMEDFHDLKNPQEPIKIYIPGVAYGDDIRTYQFKIMLMEGWRREKWIFGKFETAYAQAMRNGHKKCARKLFKMLLAIKEYLVLERLSIVSYERPKKPKTIEKELAANAALAKMAHDQRKSMNEAERKEDDDAIEKEGEASMKLLASMPSVEELFADEVKDVMTLKEAQKKDREHMAALRMQDEWKAEARKQKLKALFAPLSPKKSPPASPDAYSANSRYSFNRASPKSASPSRIRSMPNMPPVPKFSLKSRSSIYMEMHDESDGG
jgi:hypothetical protein